MAEARKKQTRGGRLGRLFGRLGRWSRFGRGSRPPKAPDGYEPIEDYALIGDRVSVALVSKQGSIDWACLPRMDSSSVFARILDARKGGYWQVAPEGAFETTRRYGPDTNILETTFTTEEGSATLIDFMPPQSVELERLGDSAIVRLVRGTRGRVRFTTHFEPRFNYARAESTWSMSEGLGVRASHFDEALTLHTDLPMSIDGDAATGTFEVSEGEERVLVATYRRPGSLIWRTGIEEVARDSLEHTEAYWRRWIDRCQYAGPYQEQVRRSALVLRLLDYAPSGAIVAAPTTSLPEAIGGVRNWDYRYSWMRDSSFTLYSLYVLGYLEEGETYLSWILDMTRGQPRSMKVLYGVGGEQETVEFELPHLEGYKGSKPVRVGNGAWNQRQIDIFGELLDSAHLLYRYGGALSDDLWPMLRSVVDYVCEVWEEPDYGLWEVRSGPRHFVYSKALAWVAVDRGLRLAEACGFDCDRAKWEEGRARMHEQVLTQGYNAERGAFTQAYDYKDLDAAVLALPLRRLIDANDPRMVSTIERIRAELGIPGADHLLYRVSPSFDDGLEGKEGAFLLLSFWLVDCYTAMGRLDDAQALLERLMGYANDVGLLAEMVDPATGAHLGNFPQALTHVALINAAAHLEEAQGRRRGRTA